MIELKKTKSLNETYLIWVKDMKKNEMDQFLNFEHTMQQFIGNKAYGIAGYAGNDKHIKEYLLKATRKMLKRIDEIDTTTDHKKRLMANIEFLEDSIKQNHKWNIIFDLLRLSGRLLGYDLYSGIPLYTPFYHQTAGQYYTEKIIKGGDVMQDYYDKKNIISARIKLINELQKEGYDTLKIALILNTSEYEIKKLKKNI